MTATSPFKISRSEVGKGIGAAAAAIICLAGLSAAAQSTPDTENGRYALAPVADGVLRLDTRTGAASICTDKGAGWQKDNEALKAQLAQREPTVTGKIDEPLPKTDSLKKAEPKLSDRERKIEIPLPSDRDMDRVMTFLEQAWRRLVEMANRMQKDVTGKI